MSDGAHEGGNEGGSTETETENLSRDDGGYEDDDYVETRFESVNRANLAKRGKSEEGGNSGDRDRSHKAPDARTSPPPVAKPKTEDEKKADQIVKDNDNVEKVGPRKYSVVVDGEKHEVTEDELLKGYQTRKASDKRFMEAAKEKKTAETFLSLIKNPATLEKVLSDPRIGIDVQKWAEDLLYNKLQRESMDPRDRELMDSKERLRQYEEQERKLKDEQEAKNNEELKTKYTQDYHRDIINALGDSGLPKSVTTVKKMAYYMHKAAAKGYKLGAADVVDLVREDYTREMKDLYGSADAESLLSIFGDDLANKIREHDLKKAKGSYPKVVPRSDQSMTKDNRGKRKEISKDQWREKLQRIKDGLE